MNLIFKIKNMKATKILALPAIFLFTLAVGSCGGPTATPQSMGPSPQQGEAQPPQANSVIIENFAFSPASLTIEKGKTVTWTNEDSAPHTIKSDTFNSGTLNTGDKFQFTFNNAGTFDYSCGIHPSMKAKIIVE
jgi:plastocyanin